MLEYILHLIKNVLTCALFLHIFFVYLQQNYFFMAKNLLNKYVWLVETIYKAGSITFEELKSRSSWSYNTPNTGNK